MKIKLTPAQLEMFTADSKWTGTLDGNHWHVEPDQVDQFMTELRNQVEHVQTLPYAKFSRQIFATRYLLTKVEKMVSSGDAASDMPTSAATIDGTLEVGTVVYLRGSHDESFKVMKYNVDGSVQVYGGTMSAKMFRDFRQERLTLKRPRSMPKPKDEVQ